MNKYKIHKIRYRKSDENWQLHNPPICNQVIIKFENDTSTDWKKVTCKKCLKLKGKKPLC